MKRSLNPLLSLFTLCVALFTVEMLFSCSPQWHAGTGNVKHNLVNWKQDATEKKEARKAKHELVNN